MKVLLLQDIKGLGGRHDVKNVSDGYARNFLIPRKLAVIINEKALKMKADLQLKENQALKARRDKADAIEKEEFKFTLKMGEGGEIFDSIKKEDIKKALSEKGFGEFEVLLDKPIRSLGEHQVEIDFRRGIRGKMKIIIGRSQS